LLSAQFSAGPDAGALTKYHKKSFKRQLHLIIDQHPKYTDGGAGPLDKGLDCSGYVYLAARRAGIPGVSRTTSFKMSLGFGGWRGRDIALQDARDCDLLFWTLEKDRFNGHVGVFLLGDDGEATATHASSRRGVVLDSLEGSLLRKLTRVRRLIIGE
jgi:cell wall-associated NlpC family hydrolase